MSLLHGKWHTKVLNKCKMVNRKGIMCNCVQGSVAWKTFCREAFWWTVKQIFPRRIIYSRWMSHPNILPLFCYTTCSRYCSLFMDLMDMDLHEFMLKRLEDYESLEGPF
jgi:hypothetical protein